MSRHGEVLAQNQVRMKDTCIRMKYDRSGIKNSDDWHVLCQLLTISGHQLLSEITVPRDMRESVTQNQRFGSSGIAVT